MVLPIERQSGPMVKQRVALVTTDYPPQRTSAAVQMYDLAVEMHRLGHTPVVIVPTVGLANDWAVETADGFILLRIRAPKTRDIGYVRRTIMECSLPFLMLYRLRKTPFARTRWDVVAWYSPTIFFGPLIWFLKRSSGCRTYLILRDIFPEWAVDLGLMRKGLVYSFFKGIANIQYAVADTIGVQTKSNLAYMESWRNHPGKHLEVLHNWQTPVPNTGSSIDIASTSLTGRRIAVYIGNMGIAQGMDILLDLAESLAHRDDIGFLFVGRGSEVVRLKKRVRASALTNTLFFDEVDSREMPGLLAQCFIGLLALDPRHKTHNVPGKFLTYLLAGLPVLARVNQGTDLMQLINDERVGRAFDSVTPEPLCEFLEHAIQDPAEYEVMSRGCRALATRMFSSTNSANQIVATSREAKG
jgi:glycosyltransferase involved in cell wall biosynthesis